MKRTIRETTIVERTERGRVTRHIVSIETRGPYRDREYDMDTRTGMGNTYAGCLDRIMEAYLEDCMNRVFD